MKRLNISLLKARLGTILLVVILFASSCDEFPIGIPGSSLADKISVTIDNVTPSAASATFTGKIEDGTNAIVDVTYGIEYSINPDFQGSVTRESLMPQKDGSFSFTIDHLLMATTYTYRSFVAVGKDGVKYGKSSSFTTGEVTLTVSETTATERTVTLKGRVSEQPDGVVFGIVCSTEKDPEKDENRKVETIIPAEDGTFEVTIEELTAGQTYTYKTYTFQNELVYRYGIVNTFTTNALPTADKINVNDVAPLDDTPGKVVFTGSSSDIPESLGTILSFEYSTSADFSDEDTVTESINANRSFEFTKIDLKPATTYYYRASMTVSGKTTYTDVKNFVTKEVGIAIMGHQNSETSACYMLALDYYAWNLSGIEMGLLYSTDPGCTLDSPDYGTTLIYDDPWMLGAGFYQAFLTGLTAGTTYYVRTYVKRADKYTLGETIINFTTKYSEPTASMINVNEVKPADGTPGKIVFKGSSANIAESFGAELSFQYSTSADFVEGSTVIQSINANTSFEVTNNSLKPATTYYYRATMTVSGKTTYTNVLSFTTNEIKVTANYNPVNLKETEILIGVLFDYYNWDRTGLETGVLLSTVPECLTTSSDAQMKASYDIVDPFGWTMAMMPKFTDLTPGTTYYFRSYIKRNGEYILGNEVKSFTTIASTSFVSDLSARGTANCYVVSGTGNYKFKTVKGNGTISVGKVASAEVLWESFGTATAPVAGELVKDAEYSDGYITFSTAESFKKGNAVIAAKDAGGIILWSWHIWLTDVPQEQTYNNNAGVMMDRNLGATSATPGNVGTLGLLYQWGRKDPFLNSSSISSNEEAKSTITWPSTVKSDASTGTIAYATAHPATFIRVGNPGDHIIEIYGDWLYTDSNSSDETRWQSSKTIYDPCPAGWRVPDGGDSGVWAKAFGTSKSWETLSNWNPEYKGIDFSRTDKLLGSSSPIWYPASGCQLGRDFIFNLGKCAYYWSVSSVAPDLGCGYIFSFGNDSINMTHCIDKSFGCAVRCLKE